jgi:hypothetical protein
LSVDTVRYVVVLLTPSDDVLDLVAFGWMTCFDKVCADAVRKADDGQLDVGCEVHARGLFARF